MPEKKPWWKKILEKIGIIKEEKTMIEGQTLNEPLKRDVDFFESKKDDFNESLRVEIKPKEPTKEEIVFEVLKEKGIDSRLLENPRFKEDIMKQVEIISEARNPGEELTVDTARSIAMFSLEVNKGNVSYETEKVGEGQRLIRGMYYSMEGDNYIKGDVYSYVPTIEGKEANKKVIVSTYDKDGIEIKREDKEGTFSSYNVNDGTIYGNVYQNTLTRTRQGVDSIYCTIEKAGVTPYGQSGIGFTMTIDNRYPEDLYIADAILMPIKIADSYEKMIEARDTYSSADLFTESEKREELKAYQERTAKGIENSKYSKALTEMASKYPEYAKLLEQEKDM
ncbi:MAG: hypothetical protein E7311_01270 [Clostridiales bacterium]|nr:hypothetical protein [Clostridiales bacterium]